MSTEPEEKKAFTGRTRVLKKRWSVRFTDKLSRYTITIGGIGTIIAVSTVCLFLVWVVLPLFQPATMGEPRTLSRSMGEAKPIAMRIDEYRIMGWTLDEAGSLEVFRLDNGKSLGKKTLFDRKLTAHFLSSENDSVVFGFAASLGFSLALIIFTGLRGKIDRSNPPKAFQGVAIALVTAGLLSLAFMGFASLVKQ